MICNYGHFHSGMDSSDSVRELKGCMFACLVVAMVAGAAITVAAYVAAEVFVVCVWGGG